MSSGVFGIIKLPAPIGRSLLADLRVLREGHWNAYDPADPSLDGEYSSEGEARIDGFMDRVRTIHAPPILYRKEWIDYWSMSDQVYRWLKPLGLSFELHSTNRYALAVAANVRLDSKARATALEHLTGATQFPENEWYRSSLREALSAWEGVVDEFALLSFRQHLGTSLDDDAIRTSEDMTLEFGAGSTG